MSKPGPEHTQHETRPPTPPLAAVGAVTLEAGFLSSGFVDEREPFYRQQTKPVVGRCDDRPETPDSAVQVSQAYPDTLISLMGTAGIFGSSAGVAKNIFVATFAQYGLEKGSRLVSAILAQRGEANLDNMTVEVAHRFAGDKSPRAIRLALHSDAAKEGNPKQLQRKSHDHPTGCAYCMGAGMVSALLVDGKHPEVAAKGRQDLIRFTGSDKYFTPLLDGHNHVLETATGGKSEEYRVGRHVYEAIENQGGATMILAGVPHNPAKKTGVIHNFVPGTVSMPNQANEKGKGFYPIDVVQMAAAILRNFPGLKLNPKLVMDAIMLDTVPVCAVLGAHDADPDLYGKWDPNSVATGKRGDPEAAEKHLRQVQAA